MLSVIFFDVPDILLECPRFVITWKLNSFPVPQVHLRPSNLCCVG